MWDAIRAVEGLMTEEDKEMLAAIRAPKIVAVPPMDTRNSLVVMPDGEIRAYGVEEKEDFADWSHPVYLASRDGGLSWKRHKVKGIPAASGTRMPNGKYISVVSAKGGESGLCLARKGYTAGTYAIIADSPDDEDFRAVKISDLGIFDQYLPLVLDSGHIGCSGQIVEKGVNKCVFLRSDDMGESWTLRVLGDAPVHEAAWPHKGPRWQNRTSECTLTQKNDGTLWILARTSQDFFYEFFSNDEGESWTEATPSPFRGTLTSPRTLRLSDGRLLTCFNNTQPLPELDHAAQMPALDEDEIAGVWEDVFTNRDANHAAISDDDGKTWRGFREMALNVIRDNCDYRTVGPANDSRDKSVHQFQMIELPLGKVLVSYGQNEIARKLMIFDPNWLLETERHEDFRSGLGNLSTQVYLKSVSGGFRMAGHCSWNRTHGAVLMPDPDMNFEEALFFCRTIDQRLFSTTQGAVWNFPAAHAGKVTVRMRVCGQPLRLSLTDRWFNPIDETLPYYAEVSLPMEKSLLKENAFCDVTVEWTEKTAAVSVDGEPRFTLPMRGEAPHGVSYLVLQTIYTHFDYEGSYVKRLDMEGRD